MPRSILLVVPSEPREGFEALFDDAPCGLLITRQDGLIERANATFCRWVGLAAADLVGRLRFQDLLTVGGRIFHNTHFLPLLQLQGSVAEVKFDLKVADGNCVPIMVNAARQERAGGAVDRLAVFVAKERHAYERELMLARRQAENLSERQRKTEAELRDADRRKDEFLAMLAHEIRNPLAPISTATQLLKFSAEDPSRVRWVSDVIERQMGHLTNLVDDLLDVSRVTRGLVELQLEPIGLARVITSAVEQARPLLDARDHHLDVQIPVDCMVAGDRTRLVQIITNLLNNAAKYTPQGGRVSLTLLREAGFARVDVVDNGVGIDAELLPHVFELFSQAHRTPDRSQGGLGIGLALVRSLANLHGGTIEAQSDGLRHGSCFTLRLPLIEHGEIDVVEVQAGSATPGSPARLLVVDDNVDAGLMLAEVLRYAGHVVDVATSAQEAIDYLSDSEELPDLCFLDIGLPDISGFDLAAQIHRSWAQPPVLVALTGYGQPEDIVLSKAAGFDYHLVKPADPEALLRLVDGLTTGRPAGSSC